MQRKNAFCAQPSSKKSIERFLLGKIKNLYVYYVDKVKQQELYQIFA